MVKLIVGVFLCVVGLVTAHADVFSAAEFRIVTGEESKDYRFTAQLPAALVQGDELILPEGCTMEGVNAQRFGANTLLTYDFHCENGLTAGAEIVTPWYLDGAKLQVNTPTSKFATTLKRSLNTMVVPLVEEGPLTLSATQTMKRYVWQGMLHIWFGWDHLAFVLCLCLLARGRRLLALITTFTLGHSLTLALSYYQWVSLPIAPVEVLIALSICLMAREAMLCIQDYKKVAMTASVGVVILFGLIHGLGFASALSELGVPQNEVGLALLFFNLGVEIGQVAFIGVVYLVGRALQKTALEQTIRYASLLSVGTLGMFWVIERINGFGGGLI